MILRGARQVGKTSATLLFGKKYFKNIVHINLEKAEHSRLFSQAISLPEFEKTVNVVFGSSLIPGETLLFIDEIQESPHLLKLLRFFFEERPRLHVIAAGSLFEIKIKEQGVALPVGRVEFSYLYPLDFFEFLETIGESDLLKFLKSFDFKDAVPFPIHQKASTLFYEFFLVGGMPEAVKIYRQTKDIQNVNFVYSNLFTSFKDDVYKYASLATSKYLSFVLEQSPLFAGLSITYEKFASSNYKSREIHNAFDTLSKAMILYQVKATKSTSLPLLLQPKKPPKLLFLDIGLVNFQMGIQKELIQLKDLTSFYQGRIAEQIVGQNLISSFIFTPPHLFYWYKKTGSEAEIDFCLSHNGKIWGIEVKSGQAGRLKSIYQFRKATGSNKIIRVYSGQFKKEGDFVSLPFYFLPRWQDL